MTSVFAKKCNRRQCEQFLCAEFLDADGQAVYQ